MPAGLSGEAQPAYIIPPDTSVQTVVMADNIQRICSLAVSSDNDTVIRGVMLFAEQVRCCISKSDSSCILSVFHHDSRQVAIGFSALPGPC